MDSVMNYLRAAVDNDPKCPLFLGKRGEMLIELGPSGYEQAEGDLNQALKLSEDWVPSWVALADLEARRGQIERANKYLEGCAAAIESLENKNKRTPIPPFRIMGLTINLESPPPGKSPDDPALKEADRRALIMNWLQASEQWTIDSASLMMQTGKTPGAMTVNTGNLMRRLRAKMEYERAVIRMRENARPQEVIPILDKALEWEVNYFPARIEKAAELRRAGNVREAADILQPYLDPTKYPPTVSNNARLLYELGAIYTDWYANEGNEALLPKAEECFKKLHGYGDVQGINPRHVSGWIKRAELYAIAGQRANRKDTLRDARRWLANAREVLKTDTPEMKRIAQRIDDAEKGKPTTAPTRKSTP
jgi:tetratricopeptide (TPR) repeat protein